MRRALAAWRLRVWSQRVYRHGVRLQAAIDDGDRTAELAAERSVTRALARARHWKKKADR